MTTAKETPLGINLHSGFLQNCGLTINPDAAAHMGTSCNNLRYKFGSVVNSSCLFWITWAIHDAYNRGVVLQSPAGTSVYDNLISIGSGVSELLGNSKPPTYNAQDPSDAQIPADTPTWYHEGEPATTGFAIAGIGGSEGQGQTASWLPYNMTNPNHSVTQWGFVRCWALQANNEFNWNGGTLATGNSCSPVQYKDFLASFDTVASFVDYNNISACLIENAPEYLKGVYSNMNDLTSADVLGVSLSDCFGTDCITAGKVIDLSKIDKFGLPSVLLQTIYKNHAMSQSLNLALLSAGLSPEEIIDISNETATFVTKDQEVQIYGAFLVIVGSDLQDILVPLNCKTPGLITLADVLDVRKLFPCSYKSITVPVYNTTPGPTNSKTYYPVFENEGTSPRLNNPVIVEQVGTVVPAGDPPVVPRDTPPVTVEAVKPVAPNAPLNPVVVSPPAVVEAPQGGGGCVALESYVPYVEQQIYNEQPLQFAYQLCEGHSIYLADEVTLETKLGKITTAINELQPCVRIITEEGISLVCSTTAPIPTQENGIVKAPQTLLEKVGVLRNKQVYWSTVVKVESVGYKFVRAIDTGDNSFWAGEQPDSFILHHNIRVNLENAEIRKN